MNKMPSPSTNPSTSISSAPSTHYLGPHLSPDSQRRHGRTRLYISGPMSGIPEFNFPAFHAAARHYRLLGYTVINPAESFKGVVDLPISTYLRKDVNDVLTADVVVVLPGWERLSRGVRVELTVAYAIGLPICAHDLMIDTTADPNIREKVIAALGYDDVPDVGQVIPPVKAEQEVVAAPLSSLSAPSVAITTSIPLQVQVPQQSAPAPVETFDDSFATEPILDEARRVVHGARREAYSHPLDNFTRIADLWSTYLGTPITPEQTAICQVLVKVARLMHTPDHRDSIVDIAGYAATVQMVQEERSRRAAGGTS